VICNKSQRLWVRGNLRDALRRIRHPKRTEIFWIDAACINQSDGDEKSVQVQMMKRIFEQGRLVVTWLGEAGDGLEDSLQALCRVHRCELRHGHSDWYKMSKTCRGGKGIRKILPRQFSESDWELAARLFDFSYFSRKWIAQEAAVARDALLLCGSSMISWNCIDAFLFATYMFVQTHPEPAALLPHGKTMMPLIFRLQGRSSIRRGQVKTVARISSLVKLLERDHVFALLGLFQTNATRSLVPGYSLTAEDVFINTTRYLINEEGMLCIFDSIQVPTEPRTLPSWAPNWQSTKDIWLVPNCREFAVLADGGSLYKPLIRETAEIRHLVLRGLPIPAITATSSNNLAPSKHPIMSKYPYLMMAHGWSSLTGYVLMASMCILTSLYLRHLPVLGLQTPGNPTTNILLQDL
jgi:hypothetical protein